MKMPHWPVPLGAKPIQLGLARMEALLKSLSHPEKKLSPVIHFAGTNGKGSSIAFLKAILEAAGLKVHAYTSPHLVHFNERITLAGEPITDDMLYEVLEECRIAAKNIEVTFFEGTTAAAILAFSRIQADIVLLETGLGGRLDATNIIEKPLLTCITPISFDHMEFLGNTLEAIAAEKAAIMKPNTPCVTSSQLSEVMAILQAQADSLHIPLIKAENTDFPLPILGLYGEHQTINAKTAIACAQHLAISDIAITRGLQQATWPARLQKLDLSLPAPWEIWLDGAHNEGGAKALLPTLESWQDQPLYFITGMIKTKDAASFLKIFGQHISHLHAIDIPEEDSFDKTRLATIAKDLSIEASIAISAKEAIQALITQYRPGRILICGSLYLAGKILAEKADLVYHR